MQSQPQRASSSTAWAALGGALAGFCIARARPARRMLLAALGVAAGFGLWRVSRAQSARKGDWQVIAGPDSLPPEDPVDEASWESFPASDSPAYSRRRRSASVR